MRVLSNITVMYEDITQKEQDSIFTALMHQKYMLDHFIKEPIHMSGKHRETIGIQLNFTSEEDKVEFILKYL